MPVVVETSPSLDSCRLCRKAFLSSDKGHGKPHDYVPLSQLNLPAPEADLDEIFSTRFTSSMPYDIACRMLLLDKPNVVIDQVPFEQLPVEIVKRKLQLKELPDELCGPINKTLYQRFNLRYLKEKGGIPRTRSVEDLWSMNEGPWKSQQTSIESCLYEDGSDLTNVKADHCIEMEERLTVFDGYLIKRALAFLPDIPHIVHTSNHATIESLSSDCLIIKMTTFTEELISAQSGEPIRDGLPVGCLQGGVVVCIRIIIRKLSGHHEDGSSDCVCTTEVELQGHIGLARHDLYKQHDSETQWNHNEKEQEAFATNPLVPFIVRYASSDEFQKCASMLKLAFNDICDYIRSGKEKRPTNSIWQSLSPF